MARRRETLAETPAGSPAPVLFGPIKPRRRAFEEVSAEIKRLIFKGELKPGDRLPSETELAVQFHVGRQTIREALRLLELSGFIGIEKGGAGGPRIRETILNTISNAFLDSFQMGRISLEELTAARVEIEKVVLQSVFMNAGESDLKRLRENVRIAKEKVGRNEQIFDENIQFHRILAEASGNRVLAIVVESMLAIVAHFRSLFIVDLEVPREVVAIHARLLDAIEKGDQERAAAMLDKHVRGVGRRFKSLVDAAEPKI